MMDTVFMVRRPGDLPIFHVGIPDISGFMSEFLGNAGHHHVGLYVDEEHLDCWSEKDGVAKGLPFNLTIDGKDFLGTLVFTGSNVVGDIIGLTDRQQRAVERLINGTAAQVALREYSIPMPPHTSGDNV